MKPDSSTHGIDTIKDFPLFEDFECTLSVKKSKSEYDPQEHAHSVYKIGFAGASFHIIRAAIGATILLAPFAFSLVGYGVAITTMVFATILYVSNLHSLLWTEYQLCKMLKVPHLTFTSVVERSFQAAPENFQILSPFFKFLMYFYWLLPSANGIYLIVISDVCKKLFIYFGLTVEDTLPIVLANIILLCLLPRLRFLVPLSAFTSALILLNLVMIGIISMDTSHWQNAKIVGDLYKIPQFSAIFLNAVGVTAMVIPLKSEMANPKEFVSSFGVLNTSFAILTLVIGSFGLIGHLNYGAAVRSDILLNLPDGRITSIVLILYILSLSSTYVLLFYTYEDTWNDLLAARLKGSRYETVGQYCVRISINVAAYGMAATIPDLGLLVSMIGSMGILMEICLPSVLHLLVCRVVPTKPKAMWFLVFKNSAVITLSTLIFGMSMKTCICDVIKMYRKK